MNRIRIQLRPGEPVNWHWSANVECEAKTTDLFQENWVVCRNCGTKDPAIVRPGYNRSTREVIVLVEPEIRDAWRSVAVEDLPVPQPYGDFS